MTINPPGIVNDPKVRNQMSWSSDRLSVPNRAVNQDPIAAPVITNQAAIQSPVTVGSSLTTNQRSTLEAVRDRLLDIQSQEKSTPTVGETLNFNRSDTEDYPSFDEIYGQPVNQSDIMRDQLRLHQQEIDATNAVYDQMLNQARLEGQGRLGNQRAISARGGLLGSDFSAAQTDRVQNYNTDVNRGIQNERLAAIGAIMGNVRQSVVSQMAEKRAARQQGAENYLQWLSSSQDRRENNLNQLASDFMAQGINPNDLDESELSEIAREAGTSARDLLARYARQTMGGGGEGFTLSPGETRFDAAGNVVAEGGKKPGTIYSTSDGLVQVDAEGNAKKVYSTTKSSSGGSSGFKSGSLSLSNEELNGFSSELEKSRGSDGYANTSYYMENLKNFTQSGGLLVDFLKKFDPDLYLNPSDPTIPAAIRGQMKEDGNGLTFDSF